MKYRDNIYFFGATVFSIIYVFKFGYEAAIWSSLLWILIHKTFNAHKK